MLDSDNKITDKYLNYIQSVQGLDPLEETQSTTNTTTTSTDVPQDAAIGASGKVIFEKTKATVFNDAMGSRGNKLDPDNVFGCAMRYNNPAAAKQFGSQGMVESLNFGDKVKVTNLDNGKSCIVEIQDWGPNPRLADKGIDLFTKAFNYLSNTQGYQAAYNIGVLQNIKVEHLEKATSTGSSSTTTSTKQQTVENQNKQAKQTSVTNTKIGDWPAPQVGATKSIIVTFGHKLDNNSGTNGTSSTSINYAGESRSVEGVALEYAVYPVFVQELKKAGFSVIEPPAFPTSRGDAARRAYQDSIKALKEQNKAYAVELHFDDPSGKSGVIPGGKYDSSGNSLSVMDVALAKEFGSFSFNHRIPLSAPSIGISILEISQLNSTLTTLTINAVSTGNFDPLKNAILPLAQRATKALTNVAIASNVSLNKAADSVNNSSSPGVEPASNNRTLSGAQITLELGFNGEVYVANSFIHTAITNDHLTKTLTFTGHAASWVMTQRIKNTAYTNMNFKQIANKITTSYGLKLDMDDNGPTYEFFPQRGISDYESLLTEAKRLGYRVHLTGNTLTIKKREGITASKQVFVLSYGENSGVTLEVSHQASRDNGGARSSTPGSNASTGEMKFELDPKTGQLKQKRLENVVGTGKTNVSTTTGSPIKQPSPVLAKNGQSVDTTPKENELRVKGILANAEFPTTPEALTLTPDTPFKTLGFSTTKDRYWVVDTVEHTYQLGVALTKIILYSPFKAKATTNPSTPSSNSSISSPSDNSQVTNSTFNPNGPQFIRPIKGGSITSKHRTENPSRPNHKGIDISTVGGNGKGSAVYAAAAGTVTQANNNCQIGDRSCGGRAGNMVTINHGGGWVTRYMHLHPGSVTVTSGQQVKQGDLIGYESNSGDSRGTHLHFETRKDGMDLNPLKYIPST